MYVTATAQAIAAQRRHLRSSRIELLLLLCVALVSVRKWGDSPDFGQVAAGVFFFVIAVTKAHALAAGAEGAWHQARGAAETAKTLAWRYAVGGDPFPIGAEATEVDRRLVSRLADAADGVADPLIPTSPDAPQITARMRALRAAPLAERRAAYQRDRVADQRRWYIVKARQFQRRAQKWQMVMLGGELIGGAFAVLRATVKLPIDLRGVAVTVVAVSAAWLEARQYQRLARAYAATARELEDITLFDEASLAEDGWARFVDSAESVMTREHALWLATKGFVEPRSDPADP